MNGKTLGIVVGAALAAASIAHSFVYACDRSEVRTARAPGATATTMVVEVAVPMNHVRFHRVSMVCSRTTACEELKSTPIQSVRRTAHVAATLGRALVTTVGAVVGTLVNAAVDATAALV